jgi:hypothetical protein
MVPDFLGTEWGVQKESCATVRRREQVDQAVPRRNDVGTGSDDGAHQHHAISALGHDDDVTGLDHHVGLRVSIDQQLLQVDRDRLGLAQHERARQRGARRGAAGRGDHGGDRDPVADRICAGTNHLSEQVDELLARGRLRDRDRHLRIPDVLLQRLGHAVRELRQRRPGGGDPAHHRQHDRAVLADRHGTAHLGLADDGDLQHIADLHGVLLISPDRRRGTADRRGR